MQSEVRGSVGVLGYGVDGQCVTEWLCGLEDVERVVVFDDKEKEGGEIGFDLGGIDLLFRSPGFPMDHKLMIKAGEKGIQVTSSTAEVLKGFDGITVGITGSNGKTTCTALIEEFLKAEYGEDHVERGGNDGVPRVDLLRKKLQIPGVQSPLRLRSPATVGRQKNSKSQIPKSKRHLVLELSSFQLIDCPVSPNISVVLNVTPNHLNWHKDMEEYAEAKRQVVANQKQGDVAILNQNDPIVKKFADDLKSEVHWFTDKVPENIKCITHPETILAAVTTARALRVSEENIVKVLSEFPGVPHRLEFIREIDGVKWFNDSSCTTPESVVAACESFPKGKLIILMGGRDKGMDFSGLFEAIKNRGVRVVPYGEMAEMFRTQIHSNHVIKNPEPTDFKKTIEVARDASKSGDNVVLSPACASFDMFKNAKERGERFSQIVREMVGK